MRHALTLGPLLIATLAIAASCGGSSSETPWPAEPDPTIFAPVGENAGPGLIDEREDAGTREDAGRSARPRKE